VASGGVVQPVDDGARRVHLRLLGPAGAIEIRPHLVPLLPLDLTAPGTLRRRAGPPECQRWLTGPGARVRGSHTVAGCPSGRSSRISAVLFAPVARRAGRTDFILTANF
jgi:hypothetical protein